jgi:hypothetical protein
MLSEFSPKLNKTIHVFLVDIAEIQDKYQNKKYVILGWDSDT